MIAEYNKSVKPVMAGRYVAAMFHPSDAQTGRWNGYRHEEILREARKREAQMWLSPRRKESLLGKLLQWICRERGPYVGVSLISLKKKKKKAENIWIHATLFPDNNPPKLGFLFN